MSDIEDSFYCDLLEKHPINSKILHNGKSMFVSGCEPVEDRKIVYLSSKPNDDFPTRNLNR